MKAEDSSKPTSSHNTNVKSPPTSKVETTPVQQVASPTMQRIVPAIGKLFRQPYVLFLPEHIKIWTAGD